ncbi:hypothetical protein QJS66_02020 [Kocuria rhizophila]|nr:hypothetical protein QJS66_02020 [Kocuria rhizophila]
MGRDHQVAAGPARTGHHEARFADSVSGRSSPPEPLAQITVTAGYAGTLDLVARIGKVRRSTTRPRGAPLHLACEGPDPEGDPAGCRAQGGGAPLVDAAGQRAGRTGIQPWPWPWQTEALTVQAVAEHSPAHRYKSAPGQGLARSASLDAARHSCAASPAAARGSAHGSWQGAALQTRTVAGPAGTRDQPFHHPTLAKDTTASNPRIRTIGTRCRGRRGYKVNGVRRVPPGLVDARDHVRRGGRAAPPPGGRGAAGSRGVFTWDEGHAVNPRLSADEAGRRAARLPVRAGLRTRPPAGTPPSRAWTCTAIRSTAGRPRDCWPAGFQRHRPPRPAGRRPPGGSAGTPRRGGQRLPRWPADCAGADEQRVLGAAPASPRLGPLCCTARGCNRPGQHDARGQLRVAAPPPPTLRLRSHFPPAGGIHEPGTVEGADAGTPDTGGPPWRWTCSQDPRLQVVAAHRRTPPRVKQDDDAVCSGAPAEELRTFPRQEPGGPDATPCGPRASIAAVVATARSRRRPRWTRRARLIATSRSRKRRRAGRPPSSEH